MSWRLLGLTGAASLLMLGTEAIAQNPPPEPTNPVSAAAALAAAPQVTISNGLLNATVMLPDKDKGFYRGVRFDWAGLVTSLRYGKQEYYGLWFDQIAGNVRDFIFHGDNVVASPNTAAMGPVDAYDPEGPLSWHETPPGGTFLKIGVGVLRKPTDGAAYSSYAAYELVDGGVWRVTPGRDRVDFEQAVSDPSSGYGYVYRKTVRLLPGKPAMEMAHSLMNTGSKPLVTTSFNHNFLTFGGDPTAPGVSVTTPFAITPGRPLRDVAEVSGTSLTYRRALTSKESFSTPINGFGSGTGPYDVAVHNAAGAGFRAVSKTPMTSLQLWSIRSTVSAEPFVNLEVQPGKMIQWTYDYTYTKGR